MISSDGQPLQTVLDAIRVKYLDAEVVVVVTVRMRSPGRSGCKKPGRHHPSLVGTYQAEGRDLEAYDTDLAQIVKKYQPDWVVRIGWVQPLSEAFLEHFSYRVVNLHLGPPGKFPGAHAIAEAFAAFERGEIKQTGVTVQLVDENIKRGTMLATQAVPIYRSDTLDMLQPRGRAGCELLVNALRRLIQGDD